ncbi:MAG TPA: TolC family protein [Phycisphaerales bacterium]|nr:TolC family protein [Phycisphaerales bacterium]HMP37851.1 TolC family protein [Phycisphaerales bacterium]
MRGALGKPSLTPGTPARDSEGAEPRAARLRRFAAGRVLRAALTLSAAALVPAIGCQSPIQKDSTAELRRSVEAAIRQQWDEAPGGDGLVPVRRDPVSLEEELRPRLAEIAALGPPAASGAGTLDLGPDLLGKAQSEVGVSLQAAIASAVRNNLLAQQARLGPAISEAEVEAAAAVFDAVLFANVALAVQDQPTPVPVINGIPLGTGVSANRSWVFETGITKPLESGGALTVSTDATRSRNRTPGLELLPDPAWTNAVRLGFSQPLLRGFGSDVNTASIRLARNAERATVQDLRATMLALVFEVERAYWNLVVAREELRIRMWLLQVGEQVRDVLERRRDFDTRQSQYSDAVATVEQRKAGIVRARRLVRQASDRLKTLINDPAILLESEVLVAPLDFMVDSPVNLGLREGILTAVQSRPEIVKSLLRVDDASIVQLVADNSRLPTLDLTARAAWFGLSDTGGDAYSELGEGNSIDYFLGANFTQPIGNRQAEATYRAARLARSSAIIGFRRAVQDVTFEVKEALRDCQTNFELISATRSTRLAAGENLRALLVEEETLASLTPEFLNLKFQRQDRLAIAQLDEYQAMAAYNSSVAGLYAALGTGLEMNRIELDVERYTPERP